MAGLKAKLSLTQQKINRSLELAKKNQLTFLHINFFAVVVAR